MATSPLFSPPRRRAGPSLLLGAALALYLIALALPGAAAPRTSLSSAWMLVLGWSTLPDILSDRGSLLVVGIGLSHLVAVTALWAAASRRGTAALLSGLAVVLGALALTHFAVKLPVGSLLIGPAIGTYVWVAAYLLLFAHCWFSYRARRAQVRAAGA